jgi:hypothetical protein
MQSNVKISGPFDGDRELLFKDVNEVLGMFLIDVLDSKIMTHKKEGDWTGMVCEEACHGGRLDVSVIPEVYDEVVVGQVAGLEQAVHPFVDFAVDKFFNCDEIKAAMYNDGGLDVFQGHAHVLRACHWCIQIKILLLRDINLAWWVGMTLLKSNLEVWRLAPLVPTLLR